MGHLGMAIVNEEKQNVVRILADIIEFSIFDVKVRQDNGFRQPVPDGRLDPLVRTVCHDVAGVWMDEG